MKYVCILTTFVFDWKQMIRAIFNQRLYTVFVSLSGNCVCGVEQEVKVI